MSILGNKPLRFRELPVVDEVGSVTVEYVVLLVAIALGCVVALATLGPFLVRSFTAQVTWLLLPF